MKNVFGALALAMLMGACVQQTAPTKPGAEQLVERGQYVVTAIGGCNDCHTPMTPQGPDMTRSLQGASLIFQPVPAVQGMPWAPIAPPLAGGPAGYTDEQFVHLLQTGEKPDRAHARPPMPQFRMTEEDARAVVAYIKTVPRAQ